MNELLIQLGVVLAAFVSGPAILTLIKAYFNRGKAKFEADDVASAGWRRYAEKQEKRLDALEKKLEQKDDEHELAMKILIREHEDAMKNIISAHNIEKSELQGKIEILEKRVDALEGENDRLKVLAKRAGIASGEAEPVNLI